MSPFTNKVDIERAIHNMLKENIDDQSRPDQIKQNRVWIKFYKNKLEENEDKQKRTTGRELRGSRR